MRTRAQLHISPPVTQSQRPHPADSARKKVVLSFSPQNCPDTGSASGLAQCCESERVLHFLVGNGAPDAAVFRVERAARPLSDAARVGHLPPPRQPRRAHHCSGSLREMLPASRRKQRAGRPFHPTRARFSIPGVASCQSSRQAIRLGTTSRAAMRSHRPRPAASARFRVPRASAIFPRVFPPRCPRAARENPCRRGVAASDCWRFPRRRCR